MENRKSSLHDAVLFQQCEHIGDGPGNLLLQTAGGRVIGAVHGVSDGKGLGLVRVQVALFSP